jgi:hypothetical protein
MQKLKLVSTRSLGGLLALGIAFCGQSADGITTSLDLQLLPTTAMVNRLNIELEAKYLLFTLRDSELTRLSGNVLSDITYEIVNGEPVISGISLTGGNVMVQGPSTNNVNFTLSTFGQGVDVTAANVAGTFATISPPSVVMGNQFAAADHQVILNQGTLNADGFGALDSINETLNLSTDPLPLSQDSGFGTISIMQVGAQMGTQKTYEITVSLPVNDTQTIPIQSGSTTIPVTIEVSGSVIASDTFTITVPLAGDYNLDGVVDALDYTVWRNSVGTNGSGLPADGNGDMQITGADYTIWKDNYGQSSQAPGSLVSGAAVPEPSTLALAGMYAAGGLALVGRRRKG